MRLIDLRTDLSRLGQRTALHCRRDPLPGKSTAAKHPNPFMPGWLDAEPVPRRPSAGSVGVTPNDDAHPEHMRSLRKSATSGRLRLFFLGGILPGARLGLGFAGRKVQSGIAAQRVRTMLRS